MMKAEDYRVYVPVCADFDAQGRMLPRSIVWEDGERYEIDRVKSIRPGFSAKAGGEGDRYIITVHGRETNLYFERIPSVSGNHIGKWFVVRKTPRKESTAQKTDNRRQLR